MSFETDVIIVGGGPAGSTCAWKLKAGGMDVIILDKEVFPRDKLCAGWIQPKVLRQLEIEPELYPHSLTQFRTLHFYLRGRHLPLPTRQFAIRRYEFDDWLLKRANVPVYQHNAQKIQNENGGYIIDGQFRGRFLVGAGGTACPVYRTFFREHNPRAVENQITTLEEEFEYAWTDPACRLWFFDNNLAGYSWYVPKANGYVNAGIGGKVAALRARGETIQQHWDFFADKLARLGLVRNFSFKPKGYTYFLRGKTSTCQIGNALLIGDAAGLATIDMGEGIAPAVASGLRAAAAILTGKPFTLHGVPQYSVFRMLI